MKQLLNRVAKPCDVAKIRNPWLELLRILAMFGIITQHFLMHGGVGAAFGDHKAFPGWVCELVYDIVFNGSELFVLIGSYFLCRDTSPRFDRLKKLIIQVVVFEIVALILGVNYNNVELSWDTFWHRIVVDHWFIQAYIALYIIHFLLNIIITNLTRQQHLAVVIGGFFFTTILSHCFWPHPLGSENGYSLSFFVYLYFVGAFVRLHLNLDELREKVPVWAWLAAFAILAVVCWRMQYVVELPFVNRPLPFSSTGMDAPWFALKSICLFMFFISLKWNPTPEKPHFLARWTSWVSASVFGVYLLHESNLINGWIWGKIITPNLDYHSDYFLFQFISFALTLFVVCLIADKLLMLIVNFINRLTSARN